MKKFIVPLCCLALIFTFSATIMAGDKCITIQSGTIYGSDGALIETGYNEWGYNYQAHMFNGMWCDYHPYYRPGGAGHQWCLENMADVTLMMKWSDEWLSNKDCNDDGKLDRGYSCDPAIANSSACPGAWCTNHEFGGEGEDSYTYFCKIVAPPNDAYFVDANGNDKADDYVEIWYEADGTEIGPSIWGAFAITQEVESGSGATYVSPAAPGLGKY